MNLKLSLIAGLLLSSLVALAGIFAKLPLVIGAGSVAGVAFAALLMYFEVAKWAAEGLVADAKDAERWDN
jgi:hypothetical protein